MVDLQLRMWFWILFTWFKLKVGASLAWWLGKVALWSVMAQLKNTQALLLSFFLILLVMGSLGLTLINLERFKQTQLLLPTQNTQASPLLDTQSLTYQEAQDLLQRHLELLEQQPSHQQLLVNTALLYQALGNTTKSSEYWEKARAVDPNSPLVQLGQNK